MKVLLVASLLALVTVGSAAADGSHLGADWITMPEVMIRAYALGFTEITEIEAEDGVWKVKGFRSGIYTKVAVDPRTGEIAPMPRKEHKRAGH